MPWMVTIEIEQGYWEIIGNNFNSMVIQWCQKDNIGLDFGSGYLNTFSLGFKV